MNLSYCSLKICKIIMLYRINDKSTTESLLIPYIQIRNLKPTFVNLRNSKKKRKEILSEFRIYSRVYLVYI